MKQDIFYTVKNQEGVDGLVTEILEVAQESARRFNGYLRLVDANEAKKIQERINGRIRGIAHEYDAFLYRA